MKSDYWEQNGQIYCLDGKRWAINRFGQSVIVGEVLGGVSADDKGVILAQGKALKVSEVLPTPPTKNVTDNLVNKCLVCGSPVTGKRLDKNIVAPGAGKQPAGGPGS